MSQYQSIALDFLSYDQIVLVYAGTYAKVYGQAKATSVFERVLTSNKISGLISRSKFSRNAITPLDILHTLNSIPYFMFAKPETLSYAGLMVMARWKKEVNEDLYLLDDFELKTDATILIENAMGLPFIFGDPLAKQAIREILLEKVNEADKEEQEMNEKHIQAMQKEEELRIREERAAKAQDTARKAYLLMIQQDPTKAKTFLSGNQDV